jgi:hypothetical protein
VDRRNARPGLRRWVAVNNASGERPEWKEAWTSIHHDGSVTLAAAVGGHRMSGNGYFEGWLNAIEPELNFHWRVHDLARDCVNQGGISNLVVIRQPAGEEQA